MVPERAAVEATGESARTLRELIARTIGPPAAELGELLADNVRTVRALNQLATFKLTQSLLGSRGVRETRRVSSKALFPLLEFSGHESDPEMQERWAAMLANAVDPSRPQLHPAFPRILQDLSAAEVRGLDHICAGVDAFQPGPEFEVDTLHHVLAEGGVTAYDVALTENLHRLGLIQPVQGSKNSLLWEVTQLGLAFVSACRPGHSSGPDSM